MYPNLPLMKECTLLKLCCDKALAHLGWKATLTFEETIRYTAEWYHRFYKGQSDKQPQNMPGSVLTSRMVRLSSGPRIKSARL